MVCLHRNHFQNDVLYQGNPLSVKREEFCGANLELKWNKSLLSHINNFPTAPAEASNIDKGEEMEWILENKNTFVL